MKITEQHYQQLAAALNESGHFMQSDVAGYMAGGNTPKRFRWDALWMAQKAHTLPADWSREVYAYANDSHIDTAMRRHFGHSV